jgi:hypothetical protein
MIERHLSNGHFQTFFVSQDASNSPLTSEMIQFSKIFKKNNLKNVGYSISTTYGKRLILASNPENNKPITHDDIIEIVDYDPIKNIALVIGKKYPCIETPLHWMIQKARHDIFAVVTIKNNIFYEHYGNKLPITKNSRSATIDHVKSVLKTLQESKAICIRDQGVLIVGLHLKEIEKLLINIIEE